MKYVTLIISSSWQLLVRGIYQAVNEHFMLKVDVLAAGKIDNPKDLSEFDKEPIVIDNWVGASPKLQLLGVVQSAVASSSVSKVVQRKNSGELGQGHGWPRLVDAHGNDDRWSYLTDELLLLKSFMLVLRVRLQFAVYGAA